MSAGSAERIVHFQQQPEANAQPGFAERSGSAIIAMLQQAADAARRNEERAKHRANEFAQKLDASEQRIADLEAQVAEAEQRAANAEEWIVRIFQEAKERLVKPLMERSQR